MTMDKKTDELLERALNRTPDTRTDEQWAKDIATDLTKADEVWERRNRIAEQFEMVANYVRKGTIDPPVTMRWDGQSDNIESDYVILLTNEELQPSPEYLRWARSIGIRIRKRKP